MAIEDVNDPKTVNEVDPKAAAKDQGDGSAAYWKNKAEVARARHDYQAEEEAMKMLGRTPDQPAFQVKGSLDLGNMNPAEAATKAQERADKVAEGKDKDIKEANERAATAVTKLQEEKVEGLRRDFGAQMAVLTTTIEKLITAKDTRPLSEQFKEQFTTAKDIAESMGLAKTTNGQDPVVQIELKKLEFAEAQKERDSKVALEQLKWDREMKLIEIQDNREYQRAKIAQDGRRNDMIADFPRIIGGAFGKGTRSAASEQARQTVQQKAWKIQLPDGETADFDCPDCGTKIGIGPTTEIAQCINCQKQFPVERVTVPPASEEHKEPIPPGEEEEQ